MILIVEKVFLAICLLASLGICRSETMIDVRNECGLIGPDLFHIAGGIPDVNNTWPWMASLGIIQNDTGSGDWWHFCGATLITRSFLLSAAHCVSSGTIPLDSIRVRFANKDITKKSHTMVERTIIRQKIFVHPKYHYPKTYYDVSVLGIKPVEFSPVIRSICLPPLPSLNPGMYDGRGATLIGWGSIKKASSSSTFDGLSVSMLSRSTLIIYKYQFCNETYTAFEMGTRGHEVKAFIPNFFTLVTLCAGLDVSGVGSCQGDSGGPLFIFDTDTRRYIQVGIVSGGVGECGTERLPGVFTRLDHPEIQEFISNRTGIDFGVPIPPPTPMTTTTPPQVDFGNKDWAFNCDFPGHDMSKVNIPGEACGGKCAATRGCTNFAWTLEDGGTCFLKNGSASKRAAIPLLNNPGSVCGIVPKTDQNWNFFCDFPGNDIGKVQVGGKDCGDACQRHPKCTHFVWKTNDGGTCFFKEGNVTMDDAFPITDLGSVCGVLPGKMINVSPIIWRDRPNSSAMSCDFPGNDLKNVQASVGDCPRQCSTMKGCTHYTWIDGTCSLKTGVASRDMAAFKEKSVCGIVRSSQSSKVSSKENFRRISPKFSPVL